MKHENNYPLGALLMDFVKDLGHPILSMGRAVRERGLIGFSGKAQMLVGFPLQGLAVALKRVRLWLR